MGLKVQTNSGGKCYGSPEHGRAVWIVISSITKTHYGVCGACVQGFSDWSQVPMPSAKPVDDSESSLWD